MKEETFDYELLRTIETLPLGEARQKCLGLITVSKTRANRKQALIRDLTVAPNSKELSRIMWNVLLAGEGLAISNSAWQKSFGAA